MRRAPSIDQLMSRLSIDDQQATTVRGLIRGEVDPETVEGTAAWIQQCYGRPSEEELILNAIDHTIKAHGTEALWARTDSNWPSYAYCNVGDPYTDTIIYNRDADRFYIGSLGDLVARHPGRFR